MEAPLHTEFRMPEFDSSFIIAMKPRAKCVIQAAAILFPYVLQNKTQQKLHILH
jgi:hypothetical protein